VRQGFAGPLEHETQHEPVATPARPLSGATRAQ
jgi:hypothetical protein